MNLASSDVFYPEQTSKIMSATITKSDIVRAVSELPDDATLDDAYERLFVLHKIERGLKDAVEGKTYTQEEVEAHFRERRKPGR